MKLSKKKLNSLNILVIGDVAIDRYIHGTVERISPEGPIPILKVTEIEDRLGMAGNVALNCATLGCNTTLLTGLGQDKASESITELCRDKLNLEVMDYFTSTTVKNRLVSQNQILYRYDQDNLETLTDDQQIVVLEAVKSSINMYDAVILQDYGKGFFSNKLLSSIITVCKVSKVPVLVDPDVSKPLKTYLDATVIKPNNKELLKWGVDLKTFINFYCDYFIVTKGDKGMVCKDRNQKLSGHIPHSKKFVDQTGAGDSAIALLAIGLALKYDIIKCMIMANKAAGIVIEKLGTSTLTLKEFNK